MILDIVQKSTHIDISHSTKEGKIEITSVPLPPEGYENWTICGENDPNKNTQYRNIMGEPVKKIKGSKFYDLNLVEFVSKRLPPDYMDLIHGSTIPNMFSVDIETEIIDEFPGAIETKTRILCFTITAPNMATMCLSLKDKAPEIDDSQVSYWINKALEGLTWGKDLISSPTTGWAWVNQTFDTEVEMIMYFLDLFRSSMGYIGGWNFLEYDWRYITNRCNLLGIDISRSSPEFEIGKETLSDMIGQPPVPGEPIHRIIHDIMAHYIVAAGDAPLDSYTLDAVSYYELGVGKLDYDGLSLKELYEQNYSKYIAYAIVDTILVQLIHKKTSRTDWIFSFAEYLRIGVKATAGALAQADALCFEDMYINNLVYGYIKPTVEKEEFTGGFVKLPIRKYSNYVVGWDAKALYPNVKRSLNLSWENYMGKAANEEEKQKYLGKGFVVTERNSVYRNDKDYMYRRIQEKLAMQRGKFQGLQAEIWTDVLPLFTAEAERRGIKLKKDD